MTVTTTFQDLVSNAAAILADPAVEGVVLSDVGHSVRIEQAAGGWAVRLFRGAEDQGAWDGYATRAEAVAAVVGNLYGVDFDG